MDVSPILALGDDALSQIFLSLALEAAEPTTCSRDAAYSLDALMLTCKWFRATATATPIWETAANAFGLSLHHNDSHATRERVLAARDAEMILCAHGALDLRADAPPTSRMMAVMVPAL